jgi:hypothetical protein
MEYKGRGPNELETGDFPRNDVYAVSETHSIDFEISAKAANHEVNICAIFPRPLNPMAVGVAPHLQV